MPNFIVGIDVGGTKVAGGLVTYKGGLVESLVVPTRAEKGFKTSYGQIVGLIEQLIKRAGGKDNVGGVGVCAPGPLNPKTGVIINPPNLPGWQNIRLASLLNRHLHLPARVENDGNAAGLAEVLFGAAEGYRDVFYAGLGTGIGTGVIINKKIYHGKNGVGGEGGHVSIDFRSPYRCGCGTLGCIEALAAGPAMARRARVALEQDYNQPSLLRELSGRNFAKITPFMIQQAAHRGDPLAKSVIDDTGFFLGVWLGGMVSVFDPDAIVIGGGVSQIGKPLFDKIRQTIPKYTINRFVEKLPILPAKLQENVGVYGAASIFLPVGEEAESA